MEVHTENAWPRTKKIWSAPGLIFIAVLTGSLIANAYDQFFDAGPALAIIGIGAAFAIALDLFDQWRRRQKKVGPLG